MVLTLALFVWTLAGGNVKRVVGADVEHVRPDRERVNNAGTADDDQQRAVAVERGASPPDMMTLSALIDVLLGRGREFVTYGKPGLLVVGYWRRCHLV